MSLKSAWAYNAAKSEMKKCLSSNNFPKNAFLNINGHFIFSEKYEEKLYPKIYTNKKQAEISSLKLNKLGFNNFITSSWPLKIELITDLLDLDKEFIPVI
jgi:hypothetical protein